METATGGTTVHRDAEGWVAVVDDDASIRCSLARVFRVHAIPAEIFCSVEEYLRQTDGRSPGCIVLDVHLDGMGGLDLHELLVSRGAPPPIVFISGHDDIHPADVAALPGRCDYLRKPFPTAALLALVRRRLAES